MSWQKEAHKYGGLGKVDPRAPPAPQFPLTSVPSNAGANRPELTPAQRMQMLNTMLTDPHHQGHGKPPPGGHWGVPMPPPSQKSHGGHQRGHSLHDQAIGGAGWGGSPAWPGDPSSSKHAKRHSAGNGHQRPQQMQQASSWDNYASDPWSDDWTGGGSKAQDPKAWGGGGGGKDTGAGWGGSKDPATNWGNGGGGGGGGGGDWGAGSNRGGATWDIQEEEDGWDEDEEYDEYDDEEYDDYDDGGWDDPKHKKHDSYSNWGGTSHHKDKDKGKGKHTPKVRTSTSPCSPQPNLFTSVIRK